MELVYASWLMAEEEDGILSTSARYLSFPLTIPSSLGVILAKTLLPGLCRILVYSRVPSGFELLANG